MDGSQLVPQLTADPASALLQAWEAELQAFALQQLVTMTLAAEVLKAKATLASVRSHVNPRFGPSLRAGPAVC